MLVEGWTVVDQGDDGNGIATAADLVRLIERRITAGTLGPGDRMEPVRTLAGQLGLAPNTVAAAYRALGERGLLVGEGRRGTFVADRPAVAAPLPETPPDGLVDLATGTPDPNLLPDLGPALAVVADRHRPVAYGERAVEPRLVELFRADLAADDVVAENLTVVSGALDGIERVLQAHARPGDRVGVEDPGYAPVLELLAAMGLRSVPMPVDDAGVAVDGMTAALSDRVMAVIVTPRAHNPTGAAFDQARASALRVVLAERPEVLIIEDDHANRVAGAAYHTIVPAGATRWATVRSVAKALGPDLRLAALAGDETTVARVAGRMALGPGWVSHILQQVVVEVLSDPDLPPRLDRAAATYTASRAQVVERLATVGIPAHGRSGLNVWVPVVDEGVVVAGMTHRGFAVRSGARYRRLSPPGIRITVAGRSRSQLEAAIDALLEVLAGVSGATRSG
jgi:DNA-binding transcriptional MocR family regulator